MNHHDRGPQAPDWQSRSQQPFNGYQYPPAHAHATHNDYALGTTLGQLLASQDRQLFVLELIAKRVEDMPKKLIEAMQKPAPPPSRRKWPPLRDMIQIGLLVSIIITGLLKGTPLGELLIKAGKAYGF